MTNFDPKERKSNLIKKIVKVVIAFFATVLTLIIIFFACGTAFGYYSFTGEYTFLMLCTILTLVFITYTLIVFLKGKKDDSIYYVNLVNEEKYVLDDSNFIENENETTNKEEVKEEPIKEVEKVEEKKEEVIEKEDTTKKDINLIKEDNEENHENDEEEVIKANIIEEECEHIVNLSDLAYFINKYYLSLGASTTIGEQFVGAFMVSKLVLLEPSIHNDIFLDNINYCFNTDKFIISDYENRTLVNDKEFLRAVKTAKALPNNIIFFVMKNATNNDLFNYFGDVINKILNISKVTKLKVLDEEFYFPQNLRIIVSLNNKESIFSLDTELLKKMILCSFNYEESKEVTKKAKPLSLDTLNLKTIVNQLKNKYYLEEENWVKIDNLEDYFLKVNDFSFDNKFLLNIEGYASIMLSFNKSQVDALDEVYSNVILLSALTSLNKEEIDEDNDVNSVINSNFDIEEMKRTRRVIDSYMDEDLTNLKEE